MREIKFRVWDKVLKAFRPFAKLTITANKPNNTIIDLTNNDMWSQYTGLKDSNGAEIYEGDIIKAKIGVMDFILKIEFEVGKFMAVRDDDLTVFDLFTIADKCEIIGNIYGNEELLK